MAIFGDKKKEKKEKTQVKRTAQAVVLPQGRAHDVIRAPWLSEKALITTEKGVYAFEVSSSATKPQMAGAIKEIYKVSPRMVRIVNLPAKKKPLRSRRGVGTRAARTKAYVYLNQGDTITLA